LLLFAAKLYMLYFFMLMLEFVKLIQNITSVTDAVLLGFLD